MTLPTQCCSAQLQQPAGSASRPLAPRTHNSVWHRRTPGTTHFWQRRSGHQGSLVPSATPFGAGSSPLDDAEAYAEAQQTYMQASRLAQLQTRYEMETAFVAEEAPRGTGTDTPSESAVLALLQENGLSAREAASLYKDLYNRKANVGNSGNSPSPPAQAPQQLQQQRGGGGPLQGPFNSSSATPPRGSISPFQQQQQRGGRGNAGGGGNPLGVIPLAATGVPAHLRRGRPSGPPPPGGAPPARGAPPPAPSSTQPRPFFDPSGDVYSNSGGCGDVPFRATGSRAAAAQGLGGGAGQGRQAYSHTPNPEPSWDSWGASSNVPDDGSGNGMPTSGFESSIGAFARVPSSSSNSRPNVSAPGGQGSGSARGRQGGGSSGYDDAPMAHVSNLDAGGCGSIPDWARQGYSARPGEAPPPSPFQGMCAETVTPIPYNASSDPYSNSSGFGGSSGSAGSAPTAHVSNMDSGGCGTIPDWARQGYNMRPGEAPPPSPFQGMCAETVTPIPYNPSGDPYNSSGFGGSSNGSSARGGGSAPAANARAGQSLGGCGSVPTDYAMWDNDEIFQEQPPSKPSPKPSPFQSGCAESVTPIPYNPVADPFNRSAFAPPANPNNNNGNGGNDRAPSAGGRGAAPPAASGASQRAAPRGEPTSQDVWAVQGPHLGSASFVQPAASEAKPQALSLSQLSARLDRWRRVLPGVNPARLAAVDADFLHADVTMGLRALILLVAELPGRDVMGMLDRVPKLLWADDLKARLDTCVATLARLHPSRDPELAKDIVAEHPELVFRMHYYTHVTLIDELPIEIQNIICSVLADQGIGSTFRYYKNRKTDYGAELQRIADEPMM